MTRLVFLSSFLMVLGLTQNAFATQDPIKPQTMTQALDQAKKFPSKRSAGLIKLQDRGAQFLDFAVLEVLPPTKTRQTTRVVVEALYKIKNKTFRVPLKLEDLANDPACPSWHLTWSPIPEYTNALVNMVIGTSLPQVDATASSWSTTQRLPTMPVILTRFQALTPFHSIKLAIPEDVRRQLPAATAELTPPAQLYRDNATWFEKLLEKAPGPASIDVIADARVSWKTFQRVLFGAASGGAFKIYFIVRKPDQSLGVVEGAAPIFGSIPGPKRPVPFVIGFYPQAEKKSGWRLSHAAKVAAPDATSCTPQMSFCTADIKEWTKKLTTMANEIKAQNKKGVTHIMFASTGDTTLEDALPWLQRAHKALGITANKVFVGYIKR